MTAADSDAAEVVVILGMHRSGTSALAGCLEAAGLPLGAVTVASPNQPKGSKEHRVIRSLNEAVLHHSGGSWDAPPPHLEWTDVQATLRDQTIATMTEANPRRWGFKDPRTLLTIAFWHEGLTKAPTAVRHVATFRHPTMVARSLARRNGMSTEQSLALWRRYNRELLALCETKPVELVDFDSAEDIYRADMAAIADHLMPGASTVGIDFFESEHREVAVDAVAPVADAETESLYRSLVELHRAQRREQ